jgi:hypothetical protein
MTLRGLRVVSKGSSIGRDSRDVEERRVRDKSHDSDGTTVAEAAQLLGISEGAVRKRVERDKLAADHTPDGRLVVYLNRDTTSATHDTTHDRPRQSRGDRYTRSLEEQVEYLRGQLDQERNASAELRQIVAGLTQANAEHARTIREIEAPTAQEPTDAAETTEEAPERAEPGPATVGAQEGARRPWWRRVIGR